MALTEKKVREKILAEIWTLRPHSKKIRRNFFTNDRSNWTGHFTHEVEIGGVQTKVTEAWIVRRVGYRPRSKGNPYEQYVFEILGFKGYVQGTDAENSEDEWQETVEKIANRLAATDIENPVWNFEGEDDGVTTELVDVRPIGLIEAGGQLHAATGRLTAIIHRC